MEMLIGYLDSGETFSECTIFFPLTRFRAALKPHTMWLYVVFECYGMKVDTQSMLET